jgi:integrase
MMSILRELPHFEGPYLFTTTSGKKAINGFSKLKTRLGRIILSEQTTLAAWSLHDLRRSAATWMAGAGVPPQVLSALLNHSPGKVQGILAVYNRFRYVEERRAALEKWAAHLITLAEPKSKSATKAG